MNVNMPSSSQRCKNVSRAKALDTWSGYTCANDVSARDWRKTRRPMVSWEDVRHVLSTRPCLATADVIPNPNTLAIRTVVSGEVLQDWNPTT